MLQETQSDAGLTHSRGKFDLTEFMCSHSCKKEMGTTLLAQQSSSQCGAKNCGFTPGQALDRVKKWSRSRWTHHSQAVRASVLWTVTTRLLWKPLSLIYLLAQFLGPHIYKRRSRELTAKNILRLAWALSHRYLESARIHKKIDRLQLYHSNQGADMSNVSYCKIQTECLLHIFPRVI